MERIHESYDGLVKGIAATLEALQRKDCIETKYILIKARRDAENFEQETARKAE